MTIEDVRKSADKMVAEVKKILGEPPWCYEHKSRRDRIAIAALSAIRISIPNSANPFNREVWGQYAESISIDAARLAYMIADEMIKESDA